jgi:hypothetical protein
MLSHSTKSIPHDWMAYFVPILNPINRLSFPVLVTLSLCAMAMDVLIHGSSLIVSIATGSSLGLLWKQSPHRLPPMPRRLRYRRWWNRRLMLSLGLGMLFLFTVFAYPAHAQFFGGAEDWMQTNFGANAGDAIPLVFNVLRGLFLLYVAISLVKVINAARQDEDWATIARTPLIIIIAVTAGDILTTLITG